MPHGHWQISTLFTIPTHKPFAVLFPPASRHLRQRAERHEPRLAGEIVKEIIADARNLQQQREEEEKRRVVAEMAAQGYHVDTETGAMLNPLR